MDVETIEHVRGLRFSVMLDDWHTGVSAGTEGSRWRKGRVRREARILLDQRIADLTPREDCVASGRHGGETRIRGRIPQDKAAVVTFPALCTNCGTPAGEVTMTPIAEPSA